MAIVPIPTPALNNNVQIQNETPRAQGTKRKRVRKIPVSTTETLLEEQVGLLKEQISWLGKIHKTMEDRNSIEREKIELKKKKIKAKTESGLD